MSLTSFYLIDNSSHGPWLAQRIAMEIPLHGGGGGIGSLPLSLSHITFPSHQITPHAAGEMLQICDEMGLSPGRRLQLGGGATEKKQAKEASAGREGAGRFVDSFGGAWENEVRDARTANEPSGKGGNVTSSLEAMGLCCSQARYHSWNLLLGGKECPHARRKSRLQT
jgi:hypothetical protein